MKSICPLAVAVWMTVTVGCGQHDGYAELGLVDVTGTVMLDSKPLSGAKIAFEGDDKRSASGTTDSAGHYSLLYDSQTRGTTPGEIVRITLAETGEGGGAAESAPAAKEPVPARYNRQSELKADVTAAKKRFDFDLKSTP